MNVVVNGSDVEVEGEEVSYELVQRVAFNGKAYSNHTVTFQNPKNEAGDAGTGGELHPGETVHCEPGTVFSVYATGDGT